MGAPSRLTLTRRGQRIPLAATSPANVPLLDRRLSRRRVAPLRAQAVQPPGAVEEHVHGGATLALDAQRARAGGGDTRPRVAQGKPRASAHTGRSGRARPRQHLRRHRRPDAVALEEAFRPEQDQPARGRRALSGFPGWRPPRGPAAPPIHRPSMGIVRSSAWRSPRPRHSSTVARFKASSPPRALTARSTSVFASGGGDGEAEGPGDGATTISWRSRDRASAAGVIPSAYRAGASRRGADRPGGQPHPAQQVLEPRVVAHLVERPAREAQQLEGALLVGLFQPGEGLVLVARGRGG